MNTIQHFNQKQLSLRLGVSEGSLERWRKEGTGPDFMKTNGLVRYRLSDIEAYEEKCLRVSTMARANQANTLAVGGQR